MLGPLPTYQPTYLSSSIYLGGLVRLLPAPLGAPASLSLVYALLYASIYASSFAPHDFILIRTFACSRLWDSALTRTSLYPQQREGKLRSRRLLSGASPTAHPPTAPSRRNLGVINHRFLDSDARKFMMAYILFLGSREEIARALVATADRV